jgi:hypothetical protein
MTAAHDQLTTIHILSRVPEHTPVPGDPHYELHQRAVARLKRQGLWTCALGDELCDGEPELHHTFVEMDLIDRADPAKVASALGLHFENDEDFQTWAQSPGNLEVLCVAHHRAHYGIHVIPGPLWEAIRFHRAGTPPPAESVPGKAAKR